MDLDLSLRMSAWFYIDSNGCEQGPFTSEEMVGWHQARDLPANLLLRRDIDSHFSRLDTFPSLFGCATSDAGLPPRLPSSISSPPTLFGATYGIDLGDHAGIPWINGSDNDYGWQTRGMQPEQVPWMNGNALASSDYRWRIGEIPPAELACRNESSGGAADHEWQEIEMQPRELPWMNGSGPAGAGHKRQVKLAVIKEENLLYSKHEHPETSQPELPKDINVDLLQKIRKAFKNTFHSGKDKAVSKDETESFEKAKIGIKEEIIESPENRIEIKEDMSEITRNTKMKIKKEYIEEEIKSEILESDNVDFMEMIEENDNMNSCVNNAEEIQKPTEAFPINKQGSESPEAEALRNFNEIQKNGEMPMKGNKKPSQYAAKLVKVNGQRNRNVANQYGSGKRKNVKHRPWKYRPKNSKIGTDKRISKNFMNKKPLSRPKSKSVNSYESISSSNLNKRPKNGFRSKSVNSYESDRKQGNKNPDWPFYEWKCPRLNCGGIIMRRSVTCVACKRENPCVGVCQTEGCGQFNWLSMMVCPKCHQDVKPKHYSSNTKDKRKNQDVKPKQYASNTKDKRTKNGVPQMSPGCKTQTLC